MRTLVDIAGWSALALIAINAYAKQSQPDPAPPADNPVVVQQLQDNLKNIEAMSADMDARGWTEQPSVELTPSQNQRLDAVSEQVATIKNELSAYLAARGKDHQCPCGPNCKCVGECKCAYPGECLKAEPTSAEPHWYTNLNEVRRAAQKSKLPVLVHFYSQTCAPCKLMDQRVFPDQRVQEYIAQNFVAARVDVGTMSEKGWADWGLRTVPADVIIQAGWPTGGKFRRIKFTTDPAAYLRAMQQGVAWAKQPLQEKSVVRQSVQSQPAYYEPQPVFYYEPTPMYWGGYMGGGCASGNCGW